MAHTLAELQELARDYNAAYAPIPLKQPKLALAAQLEQRGALGAGPGHGREPRRGRGARGCDLGAKGGGPAAV